jgi:AraC family transcriptional regulator
MAALGRVYFWQGGSLWVGRGSGRSRWHEHHAHQISLPLEGACLFRSGESAGWTEFAGAFVHSERRHQFEIDDIAIAQLFVEPETAQGRTLGARFVDADVSPLPESERVVMAAMLKAACRSGVVDSEVIAAAQAAIAVLAGASTTGSAVDARIGKALELIRLRIRGPIRLADAASAAALSPSRFRHLFVQETGAAFRPYVLWSRLNAAIECSMAGGSWTDAAHEAGFADSAHLTRTFRRMFGMNPATLVRK